MVCRILTLVTPPRPPVGAMRPQEGAVIPPVRACRVDQGRTTSALSCAGCPMEIAVPVIEFGCSSKMLHRCHLRHQPSTQASSRASGAMNETRCTAALCGHPLRARSSPPNGAGVLPLDLSDAHGSATCCQTLAGGRASGWAGPPGRAGIGDQLFRARPRRRLGSRSSTTTSAACR